MAVLVPVSTSVPVLAPATVMPAGGVPTFNVPLGTDSVTVTGVPKASDSASPIAKSIWPPILVA